MSINHQVAFGVEFPRVRWDVDIALQDGLRIGVSNQQAIDSGLQKIGPVNPSTKLDYTPVNQKGCGGRSASFAASQVYSNAYGLNGTSVVRNNLRGQVSEVIEKGYSSPDYTSRRLNEEVNSFDASGYGSGAFMEEFARDLLVYNPRESGVNLGDSRF